MARWAKTFSFLSWSASRPKDPLPGDELDTALAEGRKAVNELDAELKSIRRADGKLAPGIVDEAAIDPDIFKNLSKNVTDAAAAAIAALATDTARATQAVHDAETAAHNAARDAQRAVEAAKVLDKDGASALARAMRASIEAKESLARAEKAGTNISNAENHAIQAANLAEEWAKVSNVWAEYMPTTIPPNILAMMGITGDHWSARWWAHRAATMVTAKDVVKGYGRRLQFLLAKNRTVFDDLDDLSQPLIFTPGVDQVEVFLNGVLLTPGQDYDENIPNTIILSKAAETGNVVSIFVTRPSGGGGGTGGGVVLGDAEPFAPDHGTMWVLSDASAFVWDNVNSFWIQIAGASW